MQHIIMLPARVNVPEPAHADWKLVKCPVCAAECWESDLSRMASRLFPGIKAACTPCALKISMQNHPDRSE